MVQLLIRASLTVSEPRTQIISASQEANGGNPPPLWQKAMAGSVAGALGAVIGNPADLTLVRMQADR